MAERPDPIHPPAPFAIQDGCAFLDLDGRIGYLDETLARMCGLTAAAMARRPIAELFAGMAAEPLAALAQRAVEERLPLREIVTAAGPGALFRFLDLRLAPVPGGTLLLCTDITQRLQAEATSRARAGVLEAINEVFRAAMTEDTLEGLAGRCLQVACSLTRSPLGVIGLVNGQGDLDALAVHNECWEEAGLSAGQALARMRGLPPAAFWAEVLARGRCLVQNTPDRLGGHIVPLRRALGVPLALDGANRGFLGLANKAEDYGRPDQEAMEPLSGAIVEALARKRMELSVQGLNASLEQRRAEMQAAMEELDTFSYSVSHDLRAPLRHIIGFSELLQKELADTAGEKAAHYLATSLGAAQRMSHLIDELLKFSRSVRAVPSLRRVDLEALAREVVAGLAPECQGRAVEWEVAPMPAVSADPVLLRSVLANLLGNALKFSRDRDPARIRVSAAVQGLEAVVTVADNGVGFNPRYAHKLFGVFQRLHPAAQFEGSGIGLANVRRIILRHGGRTWAEGQEGAGASFHFSLPLAAPVPDP